MTNEKGTNSRKHGSLRFFFSKNWVSYSACEASERPSIFSSFDHEKQFDENT